MEVGEKIRVAVASISPTAVENPQNREGRKELPKVLTP